MVNGLDGWLVGGERMVGWFYGWMGRCLVGGWIHGWVD